MKDKSAFVKYITPKSMAYLCGSTHSQPLI